MSTMQRKRSAEELDVAAVVTPSHTSKRGRVVKPKQWDDGTEAPIALGGSKLARRTPPPKEDSGPSSGSDRPRRPASASASLGTAKKATVPLRDETGRFAGVRPKTAAERSQGGVPSQGGIFKSAAEKVLSKHKRLMSTGDIARMAIRYNYISCQGKTPEATMASALYTDIKRKETASIFIRPHEGLFGLREWLDQGISIEAMKGAYAAGDGDPDYQLNLPRGNGSARYRYEASVGGGEYTGDYESDEPVGGSTDGAPRGPYLPPRSKRRVSSANGIARANAPLPNWGRGSLSRAASTGAVEDSPAVRPEFAARSKSTGKDIGMMDLLLDAVVMETARSQSPDNEMDENEMEPSTAGSPLGRDTQRDDARSRRGLRAAPPKSRKLQPPSPVSIGRQNGPLLVRRKRSSMMHSNSGGMRGSALLDDDALGRSPRSVAAKARYANPSAQAIASQAEEEGMEVEGFSAARLKAVQAKLAGKGGIKLNEQVNILNLPLPDFDLEVGEDGEEDEEGLAADEAPAKDAVINEPAEAPDTAAAASGANSEDGSVAQPGPPPEPMPPSLALLHKMEMQLRSLEQTKGHMHPNVANAHMELSKAYLAAKMGEQAGKHLNRAMAILEHNTKGGLSKEAKDLMSYLLGKVDELKTAQSAAGPAAAQQQPAEPAPAPIPTPKMLQPPPYSLPGAAPNQACQGPPQTQAAPPPAQPSASAPGCPPHATLGATLLQPAVPAALSEVSAPLAEPAPIVSAPLTETPQMPPTSASAMIQTSA